MLRSRVLHMLFNLCEPFAALSVNMFSSMPAHAPFPARISMCSHGFPNSMHFQVTAVPARSSTHTSKL